jgi:hypothetical protein
VFAAVAVIVVAAAITTVLLVRQSGESVGRTASATTSTAFAGSPYDLTELPAETDLRVIGEASFVSISIPGADGKLTSYGIGSDLPAMQALSKAIQAAKAVDAQSLGPVASGAGAPAKVAALIFVLPSRQTLTFSLDLDKGIIKRGSRIWRPAGNLKALIEAATAQPN